MAPDSNADPDYWKAAYRHLQSGDYEQAVEALRAAEITGTQAGNTLVAATAGAARQICLALTAYRAEIEWHQLARGNAELRERTLNLHVQSMLAFIEEQPVAVPALKISTKPVASVVPSQPQGLWQRTLNLLKWNINERIFSPPEELQPAELMDQLSQIKDEQIAEESSGGVPLPLEQDAFEIDLTESPIESSAADFGAPVEESITATIPAEPEPAGDFVNGSVETIAAQAERPAEEPLSLTVYCLGPFRVYQNGEMMQEWNGLKGLSIIKYLITHRNSPVSKDILMDVFWPDADPEAARRNLHQAIYSLRQTLRRLEPDVQHIRFENNQYLLNPALSVWVDVEEFEERVRTGQRLESEGDAAAAMAEYGIADSLYQADFLEEDMYEEWTHIQREHLRNNYLAIARHLSQHHFQEREFSAAIALCQKILMQDNCNEEAHRLLMQSYLAQGQRHLAIRQYQTCLQILEEELDVPPSEETTELYEQIISLR